MSGRQIEDLVSNNIVLRLVTIATDRARELAERGKKEKMYSVTQKYVALDFYFLKVANLLIIVVIDTFIFLFVFTQQNACYIAESHKYKQGNMVYSMLCFQHGRLSTKETCLA